jgi:hypothetical protein
VTDGYQQFYEYWRKDSTSSRFLHEFPYKLSLRAANASSLPFRLASSTFGDQILVTKAYDGMFHHLLRLRQAGGDSRGAVLTGQPGIGAPL